MMILEFVLEGLNGSLGGDNKLGYVTSQSF